MLSRIRRIAAVAAFVVLGPVGAPGSGVATAEDLTAEQVEFLTGMTPETARKTIEMAADVRRWRDELDRAAKGDDEALVAVVERIVDEVPRLRKAYAFATEMMAVLDNLERTWRQAAAIGRDAARMAAWARDNPKVVGTVAAAYWLHTMVPPAEEIRRTLEDTWIPAVLLRENPARYMQQFAEGKLREWVARPFEADGMKLRVILPPENVPLFAPRTKVDAEIEYVPGEIVVRATGLTFEYVRGQGFPRPVLDRLTISPDFKATAIRKLRALGDELTADLDLPVTVKLAGPPDFTSDGRGAIPFDVAIELLGSDRFKAEARGLVLYPGNRVDWKDGKVTMELGFDEPVPIGTTAFGFWTAKGAFQPRDRTLEFATDISTLATRPEAMSLVVSARTTLPVKGIEIEGTLNALDTTLFNVVGKADFEAGVISGRIRSGGGEGVAGLAVMEGAFELRSERMVVSAGMRVLDQEIAEGELQLDFTDGSGTLRASSDVTLFGVNFAPSLTGRLHPGCRRLELTAVASVKVPGIKPYGDIRASVEVKFDSDKACVDVKARCSAGTVRFSVPSFHACTLPALAKEIEKMLVENYHELLENMARAEKDGRIWAARLDANTRKWIDERFGVTWKTGNPELDRFGGELSDALKDAGGGLGKLNQEIGGGLSDLREGVVGGASRLGESAGRRLSGAWKKHIKW